MKKDETLVKPISVKIPKLSKMKQNEMKLLKYIKKNNPWINQ